MVNISNNIIENLGNLVDLSPNQTIYQVPSNKKILSTLYLVINGNYNRTYSIKLNNYTIAQIGGNQRITINNLLLNENDILAYDSNGNDGGIHGTFIFRGFEV